MCATPGKVVADLGAISVDSSRLGKMGPQYPPEGHRPRPLEWEGAGESEAAGSLEENQSRKKALEGLQRNGLPARVLLALTLSLLHALSLPGSLT